MTEKTDNLSKDGQRRREQIRNSVHQRMVATVNRRRRRHVIAVVVLPMALVAGLWWLNVPPNQTPFTETARESTQPESINDPFGLAQVIEHNRDSVIEQYVVTNRDVSPRAVDRISDEQLADWLAMAGRQAYVGRIDGKLTIFSMAENGAMPLN